MNRPYYKPSRRYSYSPPDKTGNALQAIAIATCGAAWIILLLVIAFT